MVALASPACAKPGGGKGGGKGGGGNDGAGTTAISITFRDAMDDRVGSFPIGPYVDGVDSVEAFIGSKANYGNVWLRLAQSDRGLYLDFGTCVSNSCTSPFDPLYNSVLAGVISISAIKVDANDVLSDGLLGMVENGDSITAPMRIYYQFNKGDAPGFIEFNPSVKGGSPCKNKSNFVTVVRTSATTWEITSSADIASNTGNRACATLPGGDELSGIYLMPFLFTVEIL